VSYRYTLVCTIFLSHDSQERAKHNLDSWFVRNRHLMHPKYYFLFVFSHSLVLEVRVVSVRVYLFVCM